MNGKKAKQIRKKSLFILVDWVKTLVSPDEAKKLTVQDAYNLMPQQTHVYANRKLMLSAFSLKWITKKIKKLIKKKELQHITLEDLL